MKTIVAMAALACVISAPASALTGKQARSQAYAQAQNQQQPQQSRTQRRSPNRSYDVYVNGEYVGSDPDPMVRFQLRREDNSDTGD